MRGSLQLRVHCSVMVSEPSYRLRMVRNRQLREDRSSLLTCAGTLLAYALPTEPGDTPPPPPTRLPHGHTRSVFSVCFGALPPQLPPRPATEPLRIMTTGMDRVVLRWAVPMTQTGPDWKAAKVCHHTWRCKTQSPASAQGCDACAAH